MAYSAPKRSCAVAGFHFDEAEGVAVPGDEVDFAVVVRGSPALCDDNEAVASEMEAGGAFAVFTGLLTAEGGAAFGVTGDLPRPVDAAQVTKDDLLCEEDGMAQAVGGCGHTERIGLPAAGSDGTFVRLHGGGVAGAPQIGGKFRVRCTREFRVLKSAREWALGVGEGGGA